MKKKIYRTFLMLAFLTIILVSGIFVFSMNKIQHNEMQQKLQAEAVSLRDDIEEEEYRVSTLKEYAEISSVRVTIIDKNGSVVYDTAKEASEMSNHGTRPEIRQAKVEGSGNAIRLSDTLQRETYYYALRMNNGSYLRLSVQYNSIYHTFIQILPTLGFAATMILLAALLASYHMVSKIVMSLNRIDLNNPTENIPYPELSYLLNRMDKQNVKISRQIMELERQEETFRLITGNMQDGLILLDMQDRISFVNKRAYRLLDVVDTNCIGKSIYYIHRTNTFREVLDAAKKGTIYSAVEELGETKVSYSASPVIARPEDKQNGILILISDVTERSRAEKMRREFSANVSHELKTPLTSISGYAELMEYNMVPPTDVPEFGRKIHEEAARLLALVNDTIKISRLDENEVQTVKESVDMYELAQQTLENLRTAAEKQQVTFELEGTQVFCVGVRQLLFDMVYNLCENAVKYNHEGGKVHVLVEEENDNCIIEVSDTGIGIAPEYQERIFERFYRIDKSHSRQTGGTGLGLSIVKHVVEYHGGYISIHSTPEVGTTIRICLT